MFALIIGHIKHNSRGTAFPLSCIVPSENSDQHPRSLIRIYTWNSGVAKHPKRLQADSEGSDQPNAILKEMLCTGSFDI